MTELLNLRMVAAAYGQAALRIDLS